MKQYAKAYVEEVKENGRITGAIASTGAVDRMGEILDPNGWDLRNFKKAPRLLWGHDARQLPIGRIIPTSIKVDNKGRLLFDAEFAENENPFAKQVADMMRANFLNTFSVGFIPKRRDDHNPDIVKEMELLEISVVNVPANPEALASVEAAGVFKDFQEAVKQAEETTDEAEQEEESEGETQEDEGETENKEAEGQEEKSAHKVRALAEISSHLAFLEDIWSREGMNGEKVDEEVIEKVKEARRRILEAIQRLAKLESRKDAEDLIATELQKQEATEVQTVIASKKKFPTLEEAKKWMKEHDFHVSKVDETDDSWRFRQFGPERCKEGSFRTITLTEGVKAVICRPKAGKCYVADEDDLHLMRNVIAGIKELEPALGDVLKRTQPTGKEKVGREKAHVDTKIRRSLKLASRAIEIALRQTK